MPSVDPNEAQKRAVADYLESSQFARTAAQFAFGANGGAAGAVLSFMTATANSNVTSGVNRHQIFHNLSIGCSFYVAGLLVAAITMFLFARSKKRWGDAWEDAAFTGIYNFESSFASAAQKLESGAWLTLIVSALMLAVGAYFSLLGFRQ